MEEIIRPHLAGWIDPKWTQKKQRQRSQQKQRKCTTKLRLLQNDNLTGGGGMIGSMIAWHLNTQNEF